MWKIGALWLLLVTSTQANPLQHLVHYVKTHKELFIYDVAVTAGPMADAASTVHCIHYSPYCTESNSMLPARPSNAQLYLYGGAESTVLIAVGHLVWHFAPRAVDRQALIWLATPVAVIDTLQVKANVDALDRLQQGGK